MTLLVLGAMLVDGGSRMAEAEAVAERRRHRRYERDDVSLVVVDPAPQGGGAQPLGGGAQAQGGGALPSEPWVNDLSLGGMGITAREELRPGISFGFRLDLPGGPVRGRATVRWVSPQGLGYRCGIEVSGLGWLDRRRLRLFLEPGAFDGLQALDLAGLVAVAAVVALVAADLLGIRLPDLWSLVRELLGLG